jgi:hypothetical protein
MNEKKTRPTPRQLVEAARATLRLENRLALTRVEAAAALGFSHPTTIDKLCQRGLLHPSRASRRPLFPVEEIKRFLGATV